MRAALAAAVLVSGIAHAAPAPVDVRFGRHPDHWRLALEWAEPAPAEVSASAQAVTIAPFTGAPSTAERVARRLAAVVRHAVLADGALRLFLREGVEAEALTGLDPRIVAVDFRPAPTTAAAPAPDAAIVPRRRPAPDTTPPARSPRPAAVRPFPVEATSPAPHRANARPAGDTAGAARSRDTDAAADGMLPPLPQDEASPPPANGAEATPNARVTLPPPPETADAAPSPRPQEPRQAAPSTPERATDGAAIALTGPLAAPSTAASEGRAPRREAVGARDDAADAAAPAPPPTAAGAPAGDGASSDREAPPALTIRARPDALAFAFPEPVAAAAWRRGDQVWLVFAVRPDAITVPSTTAAGVERIPHPRALVWRVAVPADAPRRLEADRATWRLGPGRPPSAGEPAGAPATAGGDDAIVLRDPWLGERWHVHALGPDAGGTAATWREGARLWLPTLHGRRFRDLSAATAPSAAARGEPGAGASAPSPRPELGPLIGLAGPTRAPDAAARHRRALETALFADPVPARRLALARFLLGQARPFDTFAVLDAAAPPQDDADAAARLEALEAVAHVLAGRLERAAALLPPVDADAAPELWLWHGMLAAAREDWARAGEAFARSGQSWRRYPLPLKRRVARRAAAAALALDAPQVAQTVLRQVESDEVARPVVGELALLEARALVALGDAAAGRERLSRLERDDVAAEIRHRARLARVRLDHAAGELDDAAARALLEPDAVAWTGRDDAAAFWRFLAERRAATGDARGAFVAWRRAGMDSLGAPQRAVIDALIAGETPFEDALADAVVILERHVDDLAEGTARADRLRRLAARVAAESDALHVADRLYRRALEEPLPHAVAVDLRLELAELRLERQLPQAALAALAPLDAAVDGRIAALRAAAEAAREGRARAPAAPAAPTPSAETATRDDLEAALEAVEETLAETRRLLEDEAASDDDGDDGGT